MYRQRGVALITALLVVALATTAAVAMVSRQHLDLRRTENLLGAAQADLYAQAVEDWAAVVLTRDRKDGPIDHPKEDWAIELPPIPVDGGTISGSVVDLDGRFNLNNLTAEGAAGELARTRFARLLSLLGLDADLLNTTLDWIDGDLDTRFPGGAEDDYYQGLERPYRAANRPFVHISELRLLKGVDGEVYRTLAPHVAALPQGSTINVNTATASVLQCLGPEVSEADAEKLIEGRGDDGFASVDAFMQHEGLAGRTVVPDGLDVKSGYFEVRGLIALGRLERAYRTVIARDESGRTRLIARAQGIIE